MIAINPPHLKQSKQRQKGFTLVELMVTLAIVGVVTAAAAPAFQGILARDERVEQSNSLKKGIQLAKTKAILTKEPTFIVPIDGDWAKGFTIRQRSEIAEPIAEMAFANNNGITITSNVPSSLLFDKNSRVRPVNASFKICERAAIVGSQINIEPFGSMDTVEVTCP